MLQFIVLVTAALSVEFRTEYLALTTESLRSLVGRVGRRVWSVSTFTSEAAATASMSTNTSATNVSLSLTYFWVRHGETEANRDGILQGQSDFPLTESGKEGAVKTGVYLSQIPFDHLYSSDLGRARITANMILDENYQYGIQRQRQQQQLKTNGDSDEDNKRDGLQTVPLVRERYYGVKENMPRDCSWEEAAERVANRRGIPIEEALKDQEEPLELIIRRTQEFLNLCRNDVLKSIGGIGAMDGAGAGPGAGASVAPGDRRIERNILVCSHSGFISTLLRTLSHFGTMNRQVAYEGRLSNCSCNCIRLEYSNLNQEKPNIFIDNSLVNLHEHLTNNEEDRQFWPTLDPNIVQKSLCC